MMRLRKVPNPLFQLLFVGLLVGALVLVVVNELPWFFLLILLVLLVLLVWSLFNGRLDEPTYPPEEFYIQDQIIVRGPLLAVDDAVLAASKRVELKREKRLWFSELEDDVISCLGKCSDVDYSSFVIDLYKFTGQEKDVADAIRAINEAVGRGSDVQAEPNWLSGHPWEPTGSPWEPTGSPWEPTGSSENNEQKAEAHLFMNQWAFKQIGLDEMGEVEYGRYVRLGIFDTWPNDEAGQALAAGPVAWVEKPTPLRIGDVDDDYDLPDEVDHELDLSSHGLFAAGLAHAIAAKANIQVHRVLNKNNKGDLYSLIEALFKFINENSPGRAPEGQWGAVINMSLGVRVPPEAAGMPLPMGVQSLRDILKAAKCAKIVVIAAAGNNSANLPRPEPANLPGNWPEIIGVAASNKGMDRGCFSNRGNLAAPGGDGAPKEGEQGICFPANHTCKKDQDCQYGVIGPILKKDDNTGFAFWSGTSFAAPMVAGLAACVIEMGKGKLLPDEVRDIIICGGTVVENSDLGNRIINVPNTLNIESDCWNDYRDRLEEPKYEKVQQVAV